MRQIPAQTAETTLFADQDKVTSYAISPDGSQIAYSTSGQKLWIANSDGSEHHSLGSGIAPDWSPDGKWIVFMLTEDDGHSMLGSELYLLDTETETRLNISNTPDQVEMHPDWSPDGSWIVFDTEGRGQLFIQQVEWR
jgi:Tol biopolymer transport system component